jgi:lipoic acid synthetase
MPTHPRLPQWLKRRFPAGSQYHHTSQVLESLGMQTICTNANCPNRGECWERGTATVLILGNICTRNCKFCSVPHGKPLPPDPTEPGRLAEMVEKMDIRYLVMTSVDRDDLPDGGAAHFADCISVVRAHRPATQFEILTPDFKGAADKAIEILGAVRPFVFGHNIETVARLYPTARPGGDYNRSLELLRRAKDAWPDTHTKSAFMLGLGETDQEVAAVLKDLRAANVDRVSIGQYLRPDKNSLPVVEYIHPDKFDAIRQQALQMGFAWVMASPFTRSSYFAEQAAAK